MKAAFNELDANSSLILGAKTDNQGMLLQALKNGADVNYQSPEDGNTFMHWVIINSSQAMLDYISLNGEAFRNKRLRPEDLDNIEEKFLLEQARKIDILIPNKEGFFCFDCIPHRVQIKTRLYLQHVLDNDNRFTYDEKLVLEHRLMATIQPRGRYDIGEVYEIPVIKKIYERFNLKENFRQKEDGYVYLEPYKAPNP